MNVVVQNGTLCLDVMTMLSEEVGQMQGALHKVKVEVVINVLCIVQVRRVSDVAGIKHAEVLDFLIMIPLYGEERKALPPGRTPEV